MKKVEFSGSYFEVVRSELDRRDLELVEASEKAAKDAYAPYSRFHVGAALRLESGAMVAGNNQENVAYPSGLCAERVALFHSGAVSPNDAVLDIAISCYSENFEVKEPVTPCGACRQVLAEYEKRWGKPIRLILSGGGDKIYVLESASVLLPLSFEAESLKMGRR